MAGGFVTRVHNDLRGGLSVFIDHGGSVGTSYRHCSVVTRPIGQWVERGDVIGLSGVSGVMQIAKLWLPAHVHVTVWHGGIPADPFGESASMDDKGFWIVRNAPREPQAGDANWDYQYSWEWKPTLMVLKQTAEKHPIMWGNFGAYAHRMLPRYISFDSRGYPLPKLTLPFHE
jgi:murein DD-endopeptidase MepM/ murein hydrolase activator NlpD